MQLRARLAAARSARPRLLLTSTACRTNNKERLLSHTLQAEPDSVSSRTNHWELFPYKWQQDTWTLLFLPALFAFLISLSTASLASLSNVSLASTTSSTFLRATLPRWQAWTTVAACDCINASSVMSAAITVCMRSPPGSGLYCMGVVRHQQ